ncbi:ribose-phosphate pyrophosphokinase [Mycoplasma todarodis]|uniref:ribose-phosphate diphosphokinase n=1 Tax=Mycoplasma todarodis TaxID=1937191 RepID=A0A4R0XUU6_9MOLU|nr:ribose-phosphate pyrophosphokinase [Mycoplasma todarodis]TCG11587.1 ribose-phosphate pyrophosphokinase [Mycoplasma todarodis]
MKNNNETRIFAMENSEVLGGKISSILGIELSQIEKTKFSDGEVLVQSKDTFRNKDVFIIASTSTPVNDNIMELLLFIDSLKRASARHITVVNTYYGYSRQDRKAKGRQPIGAKLFADLLQTAGATKIIAVDLHNPSIQGFFDIPLDDLKGQFVFAPEIKKTGKFSVVSPDHGGAVRARVLAELVADTVQVAIVDKRRTGPNQSVISGILGDVKGKNCVIIDDMIDTGGTIIKAAEELKRQGAKKILIAATHGIFSKGFKHFEESDAIEHVLITDSIASVYDIKSDKLKVVSLDTFLSKIIQATIEGTSVSTIYSQIQDKL